ncbi:hypothetical protein ACO2Q3_25625 [Caulobacter sp. KR2-114]|uniref:hypothetical protein n=1 Tax=Caulobacter sp. KR2-114 TaxID=3400912 RepID=UPI003C0F8236
MFYHVANGYVFNNMMYNLSIGRYDVSLESITNEAFFRDGKYYAYFGMFCAIIRAPLLVIGGIKTIDVTSLSTAVAACVSLVMRVDAASYGLRCVRNAQASAAFSVLILLAVAASGQSIQFLKPSIYQEVASWADAVSMSFVNIAMRVILSEEASMKRYAGMALLAGLGLNCKFDFGLGLCVAFIFLASVRLLGVAGRVPPRLEARRLLPAGVLLSGLVGACLWVNYQRWGNAFTFIPLRLQFEAVAAFPDRLVRLNTLGEFNLRRVPFALQYYFFPVWQFRDHSGTLIFQEFQVRMFDIVELPPSSILLSDSATIMLAIFGVARTVRLSIVDRNVAAVAVAGGLVVPALLMLGAIACTFRYRMEFYPIIFFLAALGIGEAVQRKPEGWTVIVLALAVFVSAISAGVGRDLYLMSPWGSLTDMVAPHGWVGVYRDKQSGREVRYRGHLLPGGRLIPMRPQSASTAKTTF